jgi:hypothetical protein
MDYMPRLHALIAERGIIFKNSFVDLPLTAPRADSISAMPSLKVAGATWLVTPVIAWPSLLAGGGGAVYKPGAIYLS